MILDGMQSVEKPRREGSIRRVYGLGSNDQKGTKSA
jgi:hypothetical protein